MKIPEYFMKLVQIDSTSGNEQLIADYLSHWLIHNNFKLKRDSVGNIYADNKLGGNPLLLCAHMDTVEPGRNIKPQIHNGIIISDGTTILGADNKAAIAAIMNAVEQNNTRHLEIIFSVKEETGGGIEYVPFEWIRSKKAILFDSAHPLGGIVLRSPFISNFTAKITGKAAHSSTPEVGINAFTPALQALSLIPTGTLDGGETTVNIGKIAGGTGINTIPDYLELEGEVRSYNNDYFGARIENIKSIFTRECQNAKTDLLFETGGFCSGYSHMKTHSLLAKIKSIYGSHNLKTVWYEKSGISDANVLNANGIVAVNLTDGVKHPHSKDEQIAVKDLEMLSRIIVSCINKL